MRLLQWPATVVGVLIVVVTVAVSVIGLVVFRRFVPQTRLHDADPVLEKIFELAAVLYAVLTAFVVVVVWEQFNEAEAAAQAEATTIVKLVRDSDALPAASQSLVRQSLIDYAKDVVYDEFPRMRHGDPIEQQSPQLSRVWEAYEQVEPATRAEIAFYEVAITRLDDLGAFRQIRLSGGQSSIPTEMWVLLLGGGAVMLIFVYMFPAPNVVVHACGVGLAAALMGFVLYLVFALEHPFVGTLAVAPDEFQHVIDVWSPP